MSKASSDSGLQTSFLWKIDSEKLFLYNYTVPNPKKHYTYSYTNINTAVIQR